MQLVIDGATSTFRQTYLFSKFPPQKTAYLELTSDKNSISVEDTRKLIESLITTTPIPRVVWIHEANLLTPAAQNTLLKTLEEPPLNTTFVLTLDNHHTLLPTIISRCQIIHLKEPSFPSTDILAEIKSLMQKGIAERLSYLNNLSKDRAEVILWLDNILAALSTTIYQTPNKKGQQILKNLAQQTIKTRTALSQNANINLAMGHFFLSLPHTK